MKKSKPVNVLIILKLRFNCLDKIKTGWQTQTCGKTGWMVAWGILHESLFLKPPESGRRKGMISWCWLSYSHFIYFWKQHSFVNVLNGPELINNDKTREWSSSGKFSPWPGHEWIALLSGQRQAFVFLCVYARLPRWLVELLETERMSVSIVVSLRGQEQCL